MSYRKRLVAALVAVTLIICLRLAMVAAETGNWKGFVITLVHTVIVAVGSWLSLRDSETPDTVSGDPVSDDRPNAPN